MIRLTAWVLFAGVVWGMHAQTFEAASIKPHEEGTLIMMSGCDGGPGSSDPGRVHCEYATLRMFIARSYSVKTQEVFGPNWLDSEHFNLDATLPHGATKEQAAAMFRNLLAERFKLALHHETRDLPGYALVVAKGGIKIQESAPAAPADEAPPTGGKLPTGKDGFPVLPPKALAGGCIILYRQGRARLQGNQVALGKLAESLSAQLDKVVLDETGLSAKYDLTLYWTPDFNEPGARGRSGAGGGNPQEASVPEINLFAAIEQQLGLKLSPRKVPRDTLVIDRVEKAPTEN